MFGTLNGGGGVGEEIKYGIHTVMSSGRARSFCGRSRFMNTHCLEQLNAIELVLSKLGRNSQTKAVL